MKFTLFSVAATLLATCLATPVPAAESDSSTIARTKVPLLRAYSPGATDHFYTTDANELQNAVTKLGYNNEGTAGYVYPNKGSGTSPLYRLYSPGATDHFYTTDVKERDNAANNLGYHNEGIVGYVFGRKTLPLVRATPLYRLYSATQQDHFYTISASEKDNAAKNLGYKYEGIAAYLPA